jgi:hypothetical protein
MNLLIDDKTNCIYCREKDALILYDNITKNIDEELHELILNLKDNVDDSVFDEKKFEDHQEACKKTMKRIPCIRKIRKFKKCMKQLKKCVTNKKCVVVCCCLVGSTVGWGIASCIVYLVYKN